MKKSLFRVWCLDVWGNKEDGYTINDRSEIGTVELSMEAEKPEILQALYEKGLIVAPKIIKAEIEILDEHPDYSVEVNGKPLFQITFEGE